MQATLISSMGNDLSAVNAARVSMGKESTELNDKDKKLITYLAKNKHDSCFEHQTATLRLKVPLFVRSQIHRHRTFSYNEISRRYVKENLEFYWPSTWRRAAANVKQGSSDEEIKPTTYIFHEWGKEGVPERFQTGVDERLDDCVDGINEMTVNLYEAMINAGVCAEQARMILPQNLYTEFYMTGNLRAWVAFLKLRLDSHAQKEVQIVAQQCADIIESLFPVSFAALMNA